MPSTDIRTAARLCISSGFRFEDAAGELLFRPFCDADAAGVVRRSPTPPSTSRWNVSKISRLRVHLYAKLFSPTPPDAMDDDGVDSPRRVENRSLAGTRI